MKVAFFIALAGLAGPSPAQQDPRSLEEHLDLLRQKLQSRQNDEQRLLDLLVRHNLGFRVRGEHWFMLPVDDAAVPIDQARERLRNEEAEVARLADRLDRLETQQDVYPETHAVSKTPPPAPLLEVPQMPPERMVTIPDLSESETLPQDVPASERSPTAGAAHLIVGSSNHGAVAGSLYNVAAALLKEAERLREWNRAEEAAELDARARRNLELALRELESLVSAEEPALVDLFYRGKCLERLLQLDILYGDLKGSADYTSRFEAMRQPYLAIMARDVGEDGRSLGPWGQSAQTALRVVRWMNDFGDYQPAIPIDSIRWNRK